MITLRKNDVGVIFRFTIVDEAGAVDLSGTTGNLILLRKPSGTLLTKSASLYNLGVDGQIQYTTIDGDINESGTWEAQAYVQVGGGEFSTSTIRFRVEPVLT